MAHTVFICHSARDKQVADAACAALEARRIPCWIAPRDILGGDEWGKAIVDAINDCRIVLLIFSAHANTSPQVRREVERAVSKAKIIVPFRIEDVLPSDAMEYALGNTHWLDALTPPAEAHLSILADTISRILQRDQPTAPLFTTPHTQVPPAAIYQPAPAASDVVSVAEPSADPSPHKYFTTLPTQLPPATVLQPAPAASDVMPVAESSTEPSPQHFTPARAQLPSPATAYQQSPPTLDVVPIAESGASPPPYKRFQLVWFVASALALLVALSFILWRHSPARTPAKTAASQPTPASTTVIAPAKPAPTHAPPEPPRAITPSVAHPGPSTAEDFKRGDAFYKVRNYEEAQPFLERGCNGGNLSACSELGDLYASGGGVTQDLARALALYRKACDGGNPEGCVGLGNMYDNGEGVSRDTVKAAAFRHKGCDGGDGFGCELLAEDYYYVSKDFAQAVIFYRKACNDGYFVGCSSLGSLYTSGQGVPKFYPQAVALFQKACDNGDVFGCDDLGDAYANGSMGLSKDLTQAATFYRKVCNGGLGIGCDKLKKLQP